MQKDDRGFHEASGMACPKCRNVFCENCCPKRVGFFFKKPVCPDCRIELAEDGVFHSPSVKG